MELKQPNTTFKCVLLTGFTLCILFVTKPTSAIVIHTDPEVMMENGTTGILRCTFKSSAVVSSRTKIMWSFQSNQPDNKFYKFSHSIYLFTEGKEFPGPAEFRDRVQLIGDINMKDASIQLSPVQFSDNGTFFCDVKNPPDVHGEEARTKLRVVQKHVVNGSESEAN